MPAQPIKVFISYRSIDSAKVDAIVARLTAIKQDDNVTPLYSVWQDKYGIPAGKDWWAAIVDAIIACDVFIFFMSQAALNSDVCRAELRYAYQRNRPIVPVVLEGEYTYNKITGKNDIAYWAQIPSDLNEARVQFLFYDGAGFFEKLQTAVADFRREPGRWQDVNQPRPVDPREDSDAHNKSTVVYAEACDYAGRLEFATAEKLFRKLIMRNDVDFAPIAREWLEILNQYGNLIDLDAHPATRFRVRTSWTQYLKLFPKDFLEAVFDPKDFAARFDSKVVPAAVNHSTLTSSHEEERRLDAAMPREATVKKLTEIWVQVCLPMSAGFRQRLPYMTREGDLIDQRDVREGQLAVSFPVNPTTGEVMPIVARVEVIAPDFELDTPLQRIRISPRLDSGLLIFHATPLTLNERSRIHIKLTSEVDGTVITLGAVSLYTRIQSDIPKNVLWTLISGSLSDPGGAQSGITPEGESFGSSAPLPMIDDVLSPLSNITQNNERGANVTVTGDHNTISLGGERADEKPVLNVSPPPPASPIKPITPMPQPTVPAAAPATPPRTETSGAPLSRETFNKLVNLLVPFMDTLSQRQALLNMALHDCRVLSQINWEGAPHVFTVQMAQTLIRFGECSPGHKAIVMLLQEIRAQTGEDNHAPIDALIALYRR